MERALDLSLLSGALAGRPKLPSAEELQELMADMELQLFLQTSNLPEKLIQAAWYLHGVASVAQARERYSLARQRQAFLVSAHIFDLALNQPDRARADRLSLGFAAAIGYRRGGRDPNATAILNRLRSDIGTEIPVQEHLDTLAMETGLAFLGFETRTLHHWFGLWRRQLHELASLSELPDLTTTAIGPTHLTVLGADDLLAYFARGDEDRFDRGMTRLREVAVGATGPNDINAQWVAAHLLNLAEDARAGSLWNPSVLPARVPDLVRQAFTLGRPPVLTLWEPQRDLLTGGRSPLDLDVRRMVLAVPTSGGKTLVGQLFSVEYLAATNRSVCYVVPTRSLGREVRRAMADRLRALDREVPPEPSDFPSLDDLFASLDSTSDPEVEVMTPERLAHLLRHDAMGVLERFGMFIFDEAQLLKEHGRGFILESTIAIIDHLTKQTDHRIVLISAAMGNAGQVAQWLDPDGECLHYESEWRGPRRLHAVFTTTPHWNTTKVDELPTAKAWPFRLTTDLSGLIRLRMANGQTSRLSLTDTNWKLVRKSRFNALQQSGLTQDSSRSTPQFRIASDMITALGHAGSVLVVTSTRRLAQTLAHGIADALNEPGATTPLVEFVRLQLGDHHPLVEPLRHGVGYHHAGLPIEVLEALENAVRDETLRYLTCTSTLTEGVNLPVRTVIIYDQYYPGQPDDARLRGPRLVNAMGRAGRAGKETEGWIVLVRAASPSEQDFADLSPGPDDLTIGSTLVSEESLDALADLQTRQSDDEDALFDVADDVAGSFVSFVWTFLAIEEDHGRDPREIEVTDIVDSTLAALQSTMARGQLFGLAQSVQTAYLRSDAASRSRWRLAGTSIGTARRLDQLGDRIAKRLRRLSALNRLGDLEDPTYVSDLFGNVLTRLLSFPEAPKWEFRSSRQGGAIEVARGTLLSAWLSGAPLPQLADQFLPSVSDPAWRIEQMVDVVTTHFEHYLSWTLGALVEFINLHLANDDSELIVCSDLGAYVRYGVADPVALRLMRGGIRSRRLASKISAHLPTEVENGADDLREWLGAQDVGEWRSQYDATSSELLDLLDFTRTRKRSLLKGLLESGTVTLDLNTQLESVDSGVTLEPMRGEPAPASLCLYRGDALIAGIPPRDHSDLDAILSTGLELSLRVENLGAVTQLVVSTASTS